MDLAVGLIAFVIGSIFVERIIEIVKLAVKSQKVQWQVIASMVIGILLCINFKWDLPLELGFSGGIPFFGEVLTGLLISSGSNLFYDLLSKITSITTTKKVG